MRGHATGQTTLLWRSPESMIPAGHPLRRIKPLADTALRRMAPALDALYAPGGRPSIPPERLLKAHLLIALHSVRSERQFCEQLGYNMLFRWFLDMNPDEEAFDATVFSKNRRRLAEHDTGRALFAEVVRLADEQDLLSDEHFTVDGTIVEACAAVKSMRPRGESPADRPPPDDPGNPTVDFRGEKRRNATHVSTTDPDSRLYRKSNATTPRLCFLGHALMENRHGLLVDVAVTTATGMAEREAALAMLDRRARPAATLGADKGYDTRDFVAALAARGIAPHIAANDTATHATAVPAAVRATAGYATSLRLRKLVEEIFGWGKTVGGLRRMRVRGRPRVETQVHFIGAAYNLVRLAGLLARRMAAMLAAAPPATVAAPAA